MSWRQRRKVFRPPELKVPALPVCWSNATGPQDVPTWTLNLPTPSSSTSQGERWVARFSRRGTGYWQHTSWQTPKRFGAGCQVERGSRRQPPYFNFSKDLLAPFQTELPWALREWSMSAVADMRQNLKNNHLAPPSIHQPLGPARREKVLKLEPAFPVTKASFSKGAEPQREREVAGHLFAFAMLPSWSVPEYSASMSITKLPTLRLLFSHELLEPGRFWSVTELFIHNPRLGLPGYNSFKSSSPPSYYLMRNARKAAWFRGNRGFIVFLA